MAISGSRLFAYQAGEVTTDASGNIASGWTLTVWEDRACTVPVTGLYDVTTDAPLGSLLSNLQGRFFFAAVTTLDRLWVKPNPPAGQEPGPGEITPYLVFAIDLSGSAISDYPPASGIPETDLASAVQTKIDATAGLRTDLTALQDQVNGLPAPGEGPTGPAGPSEVVLYWAGALPAVNTVSGIRPNTFGATKVITRIQFVLNTTSTSGAVTIDVLKNGTAITSTANRLTLGANPATKKSQVVTVFTASSWADGEDLSIKFIASGTGAANLTVYVGIQDA